VTQAGCWGGKKDLWRRRGEPSRVLQEAREVLIWMKEGPAVEARRTCRGAGGLPLPCGGAGGMLLSCGGASGLSLCWQEGRNWQYPCCVLLCYWQGDVLPISFVLLNNGSKWDTNLLHGFNQQLRCIYCSCVMHLQPLCCVLHFLYFLKTIRNCLIDLSGAETIVIAKFVWSWTNLWSFPKKNRNLGRLASEL